MKIYLACPYSTKIPFLKWWRFWQVNKYAARLMDVGYIVFSPISHSHPISKFTMADSNDSKYWINQDLSFIEWCDEVWIYCLPGWDKSKGIKAEIREAEKQHKPIQFKEVFL